MEILREIYQRFGARTLMIAAIVGVIFIGFATWPMWSDMLKKEVPVEIVTEGEQKDYAKDAPYAGERTMSLDGVYSIKVPNNLQFVKPTQKPDSIEALPLENQHFAQLYNVGKDVPPHIEKKKTEEYGSPWLFRSVKTFTDIAAEDANVEIEKTEFVLNDGTKGELYMKNTGSYIGEAAGGWQYIYRFEAYDRKVEVIWTTRTDAGVKPDQSEVDFVGEVVKSLRITKA